MAAARGATEAEAVAEAEAEAEAAVSAVAARCDPGRRALGRGGRGGGRRGRGRGPNPLSPRQGFRLDRAGTTKLERLVGISASLISPTRLEHKPEVAHLQQNNLVSTEWHCGQWEIFFGLSSGPLLTVLPEHMWQHMD